MGTKTLRKATAAETIIGSPPFPPSPSAPWVSHIPSTSAVDQHPGVTRQREVALIFVSAHAPREGCSSPSCSALPTRAHPRRLQGAGSAAAAAPLPTSHGPFPSELRCPRLQLHRRCETFVSRGDFQPLPLLGLEGDRPFPGDQNGSEHRRRRLEAPPAKEPDGRPHPVPSPEMPRCPEVLAEPEGRRAHAQPLAPRLPL